MKDSRAPRRPDGRIDSHVDGHIALLRLFAQLHGTNVDATQLADLMDQDGSPLPAPQLVHALEAVGLQARLQHGSWARLSRASLPALARMKSGDWMLVGQMDAAAVRGQQAGSAQPGTMPRGTFEANWSGQWVASQGPRAAGAGAAQREAAKFGVGWFWRSLGQYKAVLAEVVLASLFVQIFALLTPLIFQVVIDKVLTHRTLSTLDVMVAALVGLSIFEVVLGAMRHYLFSHTTHRIDAELGARLFRHLLRLPLSYFESRRSGDTVARVRELDNARGFLTGQALTCWLDLLFTFVFLAVMYAYSPTLTWIVVAALPLLFGASWLLAPLMRRKLEDKFALGADNQAFLVETCTSMETLKGQAVEGQWQRAWERRLAAYAHSAFGSGQLAGAASQFVALTSKLLTALLLYVGARQVMDGQLSVGGLIAFNMLAGRVNAPILKLASLWQDFTQAKVSIRRLADILDAPAEPAWTSSHAAPPALRGHVAFEDVSFRYVAQRPEVLSGFNLKVEAGEVIGVVGVSGAGKTSLVRLLQRLYKPQQGRILVDGFDLGLLDARWLRRQIGVVAQDCVLFNRSVRENIALADPQMDMQAVIEAAQLAAAHEFILELPEGYDTVVGERGAALSGGQRARIAIARALATNPRLLLLDEATASLDYESEHLIQDRMTRICAGRTVFIVAHRLSTLRLANRLIVLERGRLIESGTHAQLMAQPGRYASLYRAHQAMEPPQQRSIGSLHAGHGAVMAMPEPRRA